MRDCPKGCGAQLADNAVACNRCGWTAPGYKATEDGNRHPVHGYRCCDFEEFGERVCGLPGTFSSSMLGTGQWYCAHHFPAFNGRYSRDDVERGLQPPRVMTSHSLTELQWYAVCKFFPSVARRASRAFVQPHPEHQLDALATLGPMMRGVALTQRPRFDRESDEERYAIQHEADLLSDATP